MSADIAEGKSYERHQVLSAELRARLATCPTSTLTTILAKLGFNNTFMADVRPNGTAPRMVAQAFTLRCIPAREDLDNMVNLSRDDALQRRALEACPPDFVLVVDARGDVRAGCVGHVFAARLKLRGCAGIVTDGALRDSAYIAALGWPTFHRAPAAPPVFLVHHPVDMDLPISCGGVAVYPGDVLVGDSDGVVVIPFDRAEEVAAGAEAVLAYDAFVAEKLAEGRSLYDLYPANTRALDEYATWRNAAR